MHPVKQIAARDAPLVERLRKICLGLPEAGERLSHGEPTWFAGKGKVFAMLDNHHHGSRHLSVWLPQPRDGQETLIEADPERFFRPPYVGPSGWVGVVLDSKPDWKMVQRLVRDAFAFVATKKLLAQLDSPDVPQSAASARPPASRGSAVPPASRGSARVPASRDSAVPPASGGSARVPASGGSARRGGPPPLGPGAGSRKVRA